MNIKKMLIEELIPANYNPRKNLTEFDREYKKLKKSIEEFGYVEPVIYNKRNNVVVGGHQRLKVLKDLGYEEVDCVVVDLDDKEEKSLNIALNKISGEWDFNKLKDLMEELDDGSFDTGLTGFDEKEMEDLMTKSFAPLDLDGEDGGRNIGSSTIDCFCPKCGFAFEVKT